MSKPKFPYQMRKRGPGPAEYIGGVLAFIVVVYAIAILLKSLLT